MQLFVLILIPDSNIYVFVRRAYNLYLSHSSQNGDEGDNSYIHDLLTIISVPLSKTMGRSRKKSTFDEELLSTPSTLTIKNINKSPALTAKTNVKKRSNAVLTAMKDEKCLKHA